MFKSLFVIIFLIVAPRSQAENSYYASFLIGTGDTFDLDSGEKNVELTLGGRAGILIYERIQLGVNYNHYQSKEATKTVAIASLLGELTYYPFREPLESAALYLGAMAGASDIVNIGALSKEATLGVRVGYDLRLGSQFSVSPEFYWNYILAQETFSLWGAHLAMTIWF